MSRELEPEELIQKVHDEIGSKGEWVFVVEGMSLGGYDYTVYYCDHAHVEDEIRELVPLGDAHDLLLFLESELDEYLQTEEGHTITITKKMYTAHQLAEIDCDM